jgi:hypothetical protein
LFEKVSSRAPCEKHDRARLGERINESRHGEAKTGCREIIRPCACEAKAKAFIAADVAKVPTIAGEA